MSAKEKSIETRAEHFDYLRVFATLAVIILHAAAQNWYTADINSYEWKIFNVYDSLVRWTVPIFVMISGALFLNKEHSIKKLYTKNILRIMIAFVFWGLIYAVVGNENGSIISILSDTVTGHYHMWFLPMLGGLYILVPVLKKIVESTKLTEYFLFWAFGFTFLLPYVSEIVNDLGIEFLIKITSMVDSVLSNMNFHFTLGYTFYFIGGFYLNSRELNKKVRFVIYTLGVMGFLSTIMLSTFFSISWQHAVSTYFGNFTINVLFESIAVFVWFKYNAHRLEKIINLQFIMKLSNWSFGVYLVHVLILEKIDLWFGLNTLSMNAVVSVPIIGLIVCVVSFMVSAILNQIPVLKKYIV